MNRDDAAALGAGDDTFIAEHDRLDLRIIDDDYLDDVAMRSYLAR